MLRVTRLLLICGLLFLVFGSSGTVASAQGLQTPPAQVAGTTYVVQGGDNLSSIAQRAYGNANLWVQIWNANNWITNPNYLLPGWRIVLPPLPPYTGGPTPGTPGLAGTWYVVQSGDNLSSIAWRAYGNAASWACIWAANNWITNPSYVQAGWRIWIPASGSCGGGNPSAARYYTVRGGDTLSGIACVYYSDCNYWRIFNANRDKLWNVNYVPAGTVLVIP